MQRHPHLTFEQASNRILWAKHEAAHFVTAVYLGHTPMKTFVRVPGRTPKNLPDHRGTFGFITGTYFGRDAAIVTAAGVIFEEARGGDCAASDVQELGRWASAQHATKEEPAKAIEQVKCEARGILRHTWKTVDCIAVGLVQRCAAGGEATGTSTSELHEITQGLLADPSLVEHRQPLVNCCFECSPTRQKVE